MPGKAQVDKFRIHGAGKVMPQIGEQVQGADGHINDGGPDICIGLDQQHPGWAVHLLNVSFFLPPHRSADAPLMRTLPLFCPRYQPSSQLPVGNKKKGFRQSRKPRCACGAPEGIRTPGLRIRSPLLYPAELQALLKRVSYHTTTPVSINKFTTETPCTPGRIKVR